jgi:MFS family permease
MQTTLKVDQGTALFAEVVSIFIVLPFMVLFGWLSDQVGRKRLMMAACVLAVTTYLPLYGGMQRAVGSNVVALESTKSTMTGAISLTAITRDSDTGLQIPAREPRHPNVPMLILLLFIHGGR